MHGENDENSSDSMDVEYSITPEGYITAPKPAEWNEGNGNFTIAIVDKNDTAMKLCWSSSEYIQNCIDRGGDDEYFFFAHQTAKDFIDAKNRGNNNTVGQYSENGKIVKIIRGTANMDRSNPPIFQFNLKHDIGDNRDVVQISTQYKSQAEFDNALVNN